MDWQKLKKNPGDWQVFKKRAKAIDSIRHFFKNEGFLEIETPVISPYLIPESYLDVFKTQLKNKLGKSQSAFLIPSPELWHKKLLAAGSGNIFEIGKSFRNTDIGSHFHNPEFTLLEWYRVDADYKDTMVDCESLLRAVFGAKFCYQGNKIDLTGDFERLSVSQAFEKYLRVKKDELFKKESLLKIGQEKGYRVSKTDQWEELFNFIFLTDIEPKLGFGRPTLLFDYPSQFAPLAKTSLKDSRFKERFELYICGVELADGYNELIDPVEQKKQLKKEEKLRKKLGKTHHPFDNDFINALNTGLPSCSGVALGVDRLVMILTDKTDIDQVRLFSSEEIFNL